MIGFYSEISMNTFTAVKAQEAAHKGPVHYIFFIVGWLGVWLFSFLAFWLL